MRILHVIPQFPYFGGRTIVGGHASCLLTLALAQHDAGDHVTILSHTDGREGRFNIDNGPDIVSLLPNAKTKTVRYGLSFCNAAVRWLDGRKSQFDVIHVHSGFPDYFWLSSRLKKTSGLPTLHTMYCPINPRGRAHWPGMRSLICKWGAELDWVGGISMNVAESLADYGMSDVECIRPAVDSKRLLQVSTQNDYRQEIGIQADDLFLLFVGNTTPQKNLSTVLKAVHELRQDYPNIRLLVTTELKHSSTDKAMRRIATLIDDLDLEDCVIQKGVVDNMPELMHACDILIAPFLDSYGPSDYFMAALEAMAVGKAVVVSNIGGMRELVTSDVGALVDPTDLASIVAALRVYCSDSEYRHDVGTNARQLIEDQFLPSHIVSKYQALCRRIAL